MFFSKQVTAECRVVTFHVWPQIKAAIGTLHVHYRAEDFQYRVEFLAIQSAVGAHMFFVIPGGNAGQLGLNRHRTAVIGAIKQETLEDLGIAGNEAGTQTGQVRALGQAMEHHAALEILATQFDARAEQARRRCLLVEVKLAVALVGGDHEVVFIRQGDEFFQGVDRNQRAGRVTRRAQEKNLAALPDVR